MENPEDIYEFIQTIWPVIASLWNDRDNNSFDYCDSCVYSRIMRRLRVDDTYWSCFFAAGFILDIFGVYNREAVTQPLPIKNIINFIDEFEPGYIYDFSILNHEFIVIYQHDGKIYYCDYYRETGRNLLDAKIYISEIYELFRMEEISYESIITYLTSYLTGDIEYHTKFHHGDINYYESYLNAYKEFPQYSELEYNKFEITFQPTITSIIDVLEHSVDDVLDEHLDEPQHKILKWKRTRSNFLNFLKNNYLYDSPSI